MTGQVRAYAHHEDRGYLQTMIRDLDEMLEAIADNIDVSQQAGYQESAGLVVSNRGLLRAEIESLLRNSHRLCRGDEFEAHGFGLGA